MTCTETCNRPRSFSHMEHCRVCHLTFASTTSGDAHRTGEHGVRDGPERRRCRTREELTAGGMWTTLDATGKEVWHGEFSKKGRQHRRSAPQATEGSDLTAEQPSGVPGSEPALQ
jgi:hypothetical protein